MSKNENANKYNLIPGDLLMFHELPYVFMVIEIRLFQITVLAAVKHRVYDAYHHIKFINDNIKSGRIIKLT